MFKIVADEIWFMVEVFAKITMPLSVLRDQAEERLDIANTDLGEHDTVEELVQQAKFDARTDAKDCVNDLITAFAEQVKEKLGAL